MSAGLMQLGFYTWDERKQLAERKMKAHDAKTPRSRKHAWGTYYGSLLPAAPSSHFTGSKHTYAMLRRRVRNANQD